jgi:vacuolar-type H+-ATPase subunit I/STV1
MKIYKLLFIIFLFTLCFNGLIVGPRVIAETIYISTDESGTTIISNSLPKNKSAVRHVIHYKPSKATDREIREFQERQKAAANRMTEKNRREEVDAAQRAAIVEKDAEKERLKNKTRREAEEYRAELLKKARRTISTVGKSSTEIANERYLKYLAEREAHKIKVFLLTGEYPKTKKATGATGGKPKFLNPSLPKPPEELIRNNTGTINPYTGTFYAPSGTGGYINTKDGTFYAPSGTGGYINTRTGEFVPAH